MDTLFSQKCLALVCQNFAVLVKARSIYLNVDFKGNINLVMKMRAVLVIPTNLKENNGKIEAIL